MNSIIRVNYTIKSHSLPSPLSSLSPSVRLSLSSHRPAMAPGFGCWHAPATSVAISNNVLTRLRSWAEKAIGPELPRRDRNREDLALQNFSHSRGNSLTAAKITTQLCVAIYSNIRRRLRRLRRTRRWRFCRSKSRYPDHWHSHCVSRRSLASSSLAKALAGVEPHRRWKCPPTERVEYHHHIHWTLGSIWGFSKVGGFFYNFEK